jgi:tRNA 2-thiouridine synthesizing protein A
MDQQATIVFDAEEMGCGELVLALSRQMRPLPPDTIMELIARDSGAIEDIPAWCRLRGYRFIAMQREGNQGPLHFWIQKTEKP